MESRPALSPSTVLFIDKFKKFLDSTGLTIDQFLQNFRTINTNQLSRLEYFRIISLINIETYNNFDSQLAFKQLSHGGETIRVPELKKLTQKIGGMISEKKQSQDKARQEEMKKKVVRIGLHKLQEFVQKHPSPIVFFYEFDADENGSINKVEFGKMLIATQIRQFASKDIRKILIDHLFKYFPKGEITVKELANFFKIKYQTYGQAKGEMPQKHHTLDCEDISHKKQTPHINKNNSLEYPKYPSPNKKDNPNPFGKKGQAEMLSPNYQPKPQMKKDDSYDNHNNDISNCFQIYPNSMRYFRQGEPEPSEYQVLEQLEAYINKNGKYLDKENPRITDGIYTSSADIFKAQFYIFQMAASVLMREKSRIGVAQQIQPKDIIQGSIGDCYFLSSIASIISIYPELISDKFLLNINPAGLYAVKLFIDGEWKVITTDDRFPCRGKTPIFAKPHYNQIWVMLLEKCWAKVFGSYKNIEAGSSKEGFIALTGAPCDVIALQKPQQAETAEKQLESAQKKRYVSTMSGSNYLESLGKKGEDQFGLIAGHAYSLLKIIPIQGQKLVKLRNPWGKTVWKGDWSFNSNKWTTSLRDKYNYHKNPDDGSFYMNWKDFTTFFGEIIICKLNPTYMHDSIRVKSNRHKSAYFSMKVTTPGHYILSIYQENKRKMLLKYQNYSYSEARVIILKRENNKMKYISSKATSQYQVCSADMEYLEEGEYIISAKVKWKFWDDHQFVLTAYGTDHVNLSPVNRAIAPLFKEHMIKSYAKMYQQTGKIKSYQKYGFEAKCETNFNLDTGIGFVRMINNSSKGFDSIQNYQTKGLKIIKPDRLPLEFKMTGPSEIIYGFFVSPGGFEYSNTEKIKY